MQGDAAANRRGQERLPGSGVACGCRTTVHRSERRCECINPPC
ncbi:hypothetical protein HMPREF3150_01604 [Pseudomonas aeruginosa]|nr:hypothetical protein HMPREF3150_01604 [Pseudomonas aeruginosa]